MMKTVIKYTILTVLFISCTKEQKYCGTCIKNDIYKIDTLNFCAGEAEVVEFTNTLSVDTSINCTIN